MERMAKAVEDGLNPVLTGTPFATGFNPSWHVQEKDLSQSRADRDTVRDKPKNEPRITFDVVSQSRADRDTVRDELFLDFGHRTVSNVSIPC